jgi:hypothetical protein
MTQPTINCSKRKVSLQNCHEAIYNATFKVHTHTHADYNLGKISHHIATKEYAMYPIMKHTKSLNRGL